MIAIVDTADELSPIGRSSDEPGEFNVHTLLLACIFDSLNIANWQRTDGKSDPPEPILSFTAQPQDDTEKAEVEDDLESFESHDESGRLTGITMSAQQWADLLGWSTEPEPEPVEVARAYAEGGITYKQLAEEYGVSASTIGRWVRKHRDDI